MATTQGCRSQLLFAAVLFALLCWGINGCDQTGVEAHRAEDGTAGPSAKVVRARVVPFTTAQGLRTQMVLVDWRNTGTTTIRAVDADIIPYGADGTKLGSGASDYAIYAVSDSSPGIAPGRKYSEPHGKGFILRPGFAKAVKVEVKITEVVESGAY